MPVLDLKNKKVERTFLENVKHKASMAFDWTKEKVQNAVEYVKEDPEKAMKAVSAVTLVAGVFSKVARSANKHQALRAEKYHREREIYDHSNGQYLELKRKLTKTDVDRLNKLKREKGLRTSEALSEMNLLKKW